MSIRSSCIKTISTAALLLAAATVSAAEPVQTYAAGGDTAPSGAAMAVDLALARPVGFIATLLGAVVFVAGLPFEALAGNISDPARRLVGDPARFTFVRPLGEDLN